MPIAVLCPGCKARFSVSEKFAGKKGPCPKCKAVIVIPEAPTAEIKVHVPEVFASAGKDTKGRPLSKPIPRAETRLPRKVVAAVAVAAVVVLVGALSMQLAPESSRWKLASLGLVLISAPLAVAGYFFLRDDELEPYSGKELWVRAAICGLAYVGLWGLYAFAQRVFDLTGDTWQWLFLAAVFIPLGAAAAWATLDLDFGNGAMHYSFYLLVTLVLCVLGGVPLMQSAGTTPLPAGATAPRP